MWATATGKTGLWFSPVQSYVYFQFCGLDLQTLFADPQSSCPLPDSYINSIPNHVTIPELVSFGGNYCQTSNYASFLLLRVAQILTVVVTSLSFVIIVMHCGCSCGFMVALWWWRSHPGGMSLAMGMVVC
jgi:hypothetical protein